MISSKLPLDTITGFVLYISSTNCTLPEEIDSKLSTLHYTEVQSTNKTVFKVKDFDMDGDEYKSFLTKGFFPNETNIHPQISLGEGLVLFNGTTLSGVGKGNLITPTASPTIKNNLTYITQTYGTNPSN
jgi:hypothetical protein